MKITVLAHLEKETSKSPDAVVEQVRDALVTAGHEASIVAVHGDVRQLVDGLTQAAPELVFNLMESFGSTYFGAIGVVGLLDLLCLRYTGGGPGEFYLQEDKALTKKLLAFDGIKYPEFAVFGQDADFESAGELHMPLFVKPLRMEASIGIDAKSIVHNTTDMMKRVTMIHEKVNDAALVEEYIEGREFYVGVIGNAQPQAFPPIEMDFSGLPEGMPKILDARAKWNKRSIEYKGTKAVVAQLSDELKARLQTVALNAYRALRVRDYGRVDLRLTETGDVYVIEVNASCYLDKKSEFAQGARAGGIEFDALVARIVELAVERYRGNAPKPKRTRGASSAEVSTPTT